MAKLSKELLARLNSCLWSDGREALEAYLERPDEVIRAFSLFKALCEARQAFEVLIAGLETTKRPLDEETKSRLKEKYTNGLKTCQETLAILDG